MALETVKVCGQGSNVAEVDAPSGRRYARDKEGIFHMTPSDAAAMVKGGGFFPSMAGSTRKGVGFRCPECGFGAYTRTCGRCGAECEKEV